MAGCSTGCIWCLAVDYILLLKQDVEYEANPNEVQAAKYYTPEEVHELLDTAGMAIFFLLLLFLFSTIFFMHFSCCRCNGSENHTMVQDHLQHVCVL